MRSLLLSRINTLQDVKFKDYLLDVWQLLLMSLMSNGTNCSFFFMVISHLLVNDSYNSTYQNVIICRREGLLIALVMIDINIL